MGLQVWLPLTQDINNQGLLDLPTPYDIRVRDTGGKIGQYCYTDGAIYHIDQEWLGNYWSLACWIKSSSWSTYNDIILCKNADSSESTQFYFSIIGGSKFNIGCNAGSQTLTVNYTFAQNTWYHVAATYNGNTLKLYLNGSEIGTKAYTSNQKMGMNNLCIGCRSVNTSGTQATVIGGKRMNDVRIYDHALSPLEVKHLAQGLVLHYPLNHEGFGQDNLLINTSDLTRWGKESGISVEWDDSVQMYKVTDSSHTSSRWGIYQDYACEPSTTYTFSVTGKKSDNNVNMGVQSFESTVSWSANVASFSENPERKSYTITTGANHTKIRVYLNMNPTTTASNTAYYLLPKLELGSVATPWTPAPSDALYSQMGLDNNIEYDVSGYGNNGIRNGAFSWSGDTPRYVTSAVFSGNQYIVEPNEIITTDSTIALWVKSSLNGNAHVLDARNNSEIGKQPIYQYVNGSIQTGGNASYVTSNSGLLVANTWVHVVLVQNGNSLLIYKNGDLFQTISCENSPVIKPTLGARLNFTNKYTGQLSDVRIYATALTADDVMALYKNAGYVDSDGNVYAYEIME